MTPFEQRFIDLYITFTIATVVVSNIIVLILKSHDSEKKRLNEVNLLLEEKMGVLSSTNVNLEKALAKVKQLSGLLPFCSYCNKIRDDKGYWNQIDSYIQDHSDAEFSHSICQECAEKHFPDLDIYDE